ncbi:MAG TPA: FAD-dependent oxidoreductase, partial [Solirubrobacteraceae bacterium]|nr:FAD-dependent oxidoreductase [Solirubrobacteraceae bacterium]
FIARREALQGVHGIGFEVLGPHSSQATLRIVEFARSNRLPFTWRDPEQADDEAAAVLVAGLDPADVPLVRLPGGVELRGPSTGELSRALGVGRELAPREQVDLVVIGAGPAGLAAAVYGASEGLETLVVESTALGGQAGSSRRIENYLGFPAGISGAELADRATIQAEKFGAHITVPVAATALDERDGRHLLRLDDGAAVAASVVVIATGVRYRRLDLPRLEEFEAHSIFYAATPMEARLCAGDPVAVVGGGNSGGQAALFLSRHAAHVRLLVRERELSEHMSRYLADRIERDPSIEVFLHSEVCELIGEHALEAIAVADQLTGDRKQVPARALFVFIGAEPHTRWLDGRLALDTGGYVLTGPAAARARGDGREPLLLETSLPGVFAVGDVRSGSAQRVAAAVGDGAVAIRLIHERLAHDGRPLAACS